MKNKLCFLVVLITGIFFLTTVKCVLAQDSVDIFVPSKIKKTILKNAEHYKGFYLKTERFLPLSSNVIILINFNAAGGIETQALKNIESIDEAKAYIDANLKVHTSADNIDIRQLPIFYLGKETVLFWVGDKSFTSLAAAQAFIRDEIILINEVGSDEPSVVAKVDELSEEKMPLSKSEQLQEKVISLASKFPKPLGELEYVSFGSVSYRTTSMSHRNYDSLVGYWEHRLLFKGYELTDSGARLDFYAFFKPELSGTSTPWENKLIYGVGTESLLFNKCESLERSLWTSWIKNLRLYAEFQNLTPIKASYDEPTYDRRAGIGLYKEYNFIENDYMPHSFKDYIWAEVWSDCAYRTTNFSDANFQSVVFGINTKLGVYIVKGLGINLMPYVFSDASANEYSNFWENRAQIGVGFRITPFRKEKYKSFQWLYNLNFFAEYHENVKYFKDGPDNQTPSSDVRIGIGYSYNRYY